MMREGLHGKCAMAVAQSMRTIRCATLRAVMKSTGVAVRLSLNIDIIMLLKVSKKLCVQRIDPAPVFNNTRTASASGRFGSIQPLYKIGAVNLIYSL